MKRTNNNLGKYVLASGLYLSSAICLATRHIAAAIVCVGSGIGGNIQRIQSPAVSASAFDDALSYNSGLAWIGALLLVGAVVVTAWAARSTAINSLDTEQNG